MLLLHLLLYLYCCQALAQVDNYLRRLGVVREAVDDTAGAAQMVSQQKLQASVGAAGICVSACWAAACERQQLRSSHDGDALRTACLTTRLCG